MLSRFSALVAFGVGIAAILVAPQKAAAVNGTWTSTVDGAWSVGTNWSGGTIADGANNTANFNTLDIADQTGVTGLPAVRVDLDTPRTIGHLVFGDTNITTPGVWEVTSAVDPVTNLLTLADATKPTITVNQLGIIEPSGPGVPPVYDDVILHPNLAGTNGFDKLGPGILTLAGTGIDHDGDELLNPAPAVITPRQMPLTGVINVNAGTLRVAPGTLFDFGTDVASPAVLSFNVATGATLDARAFVRNITAANNTTINGTSGMQFLTVGTGTVFNVSGGGVGASGNVAAATNEGVLVSGTGARTITINNSSAAATGIGNIGGGTAGLTVNANLSGTGTTRLARNWTLNGGVTTLNLTGTRTDTLPSVVELRFNNGGAFANNSFQNTAVNLTNVEVYPNQNTTGNEVIMGSLTGDATSAFRSGDGGGGATILTIGGLNTNTVFNGNIAKTAGSENSFTLTKQGTGILTLGGNLTYSPGNQDGLDARGGVTRITGGTLKLVGPATLPAGIVGTNGDYYSTVDLRTGTTLDVSGTATPYQSAALQQTIGVGTIIGPYNHADGIIAPGNTSVILNNRPTQDTVPVAGTLAFTGNLTLSGGQYLFDLGASTTTGNDRITVTGQTTLSGGTIVASFLGGTPAVGSTYTLLTSGTFAGSASNLTVKFPGRGAVTQIPFISGANLQVTVPVLGSGNLVWKGNDAGNPTAWDVETTPNFLNTGTAAADKFFTGDAVRFDDTAASFAVGLNATDVAPGSVTVDTATNNYVISGTKRIFGSGSFTKNGAGTVTMTTANTFTGGLTINGGAINREAAGGMGTGLITLNNGEIKTRAWTNAAPISNPAGTTNKITLMGGGTDPAAPTTVAYNQDGALSGSGTLQIANDTVNTTTVVQVAQAMDIRNVDNSAFTGTIRFTGASRTAPRLTQLGAAGTNVAWDLGNGEVGAVGAGLAGSGTSLTTTVQSATTANGSPHETVAFRLGSLEGGFFAQLGGYGSGAGLAPVRWEIGGRNTSTTFAGVVGDGNKGGTGDRVTANVTHLMKEGTGTLTLTGANTYTGTTTVANGTLSIALPNLADTSNVLISTVGTFNLNFAASTTDTIAALYIGGVAKAPGIWGGPGSGAANIDSHFTGLGTLTVSSLGAALLAGDFDNNKTVAAADLAFWRRSFGSGAGGDADFDGDTDGNDFAIWQRNLGTSIPSVAASGAVPEPTAWVLAAIVLPAVVSRSRRRA